MTDRDGEELFDESYADALSDCLSDFETYCGEVEIDNLSVDSYECRLLDLWNDKLAKSVVYHYVRE